MLGQHGDKALSQVGINATKVGGGDKEKAYIVRQNAMLRIALCILVSAIFILAILAVTVLDVKVQRKSAALAKMGKRQEQHFEHQNVIKKDLELQNRFLEEKNDAEMVKDARATMGSLLASYEKDLQKAVGTSAESKNVMAHHKKFAKYLKKLISDVYHNADRESISAQKAMHDIAGDIGREAAEDETEEAEYEKELENMGEDVHAYKIVDDSGNTIMPETLMPEEHADGANHEMDDHHDTPSAEEITKQLKRFWDKADAAAERYKNLDEQKLQEINDYYQTHVLKQLEAEDPETIDKTKLETEVNAHLVSKGLPAWDESMKKDFPEIIDYMQEVIDHMHARKAKEPLDKLREEIKSGSKDVMAGVAALEKIGLDGNVPLHWMWLEEMGPGFDQDEMYDAHHDDAEDHDMGGEEEHHDAGATA